MNLYLCEKPSQAHDLGRVMGVTQKHKGYLTDGADRCITWAYGHLLELYMPDDYDEQYKQWTLDTLPIAPESWRYHVRKKAFHQYKVISNLVKQADTIHIATDYDREGESIARSLLDRFRYNGPVHRVCLTGLDDASIRKALANIRDGAETRPLYFAALSRQRADWLVGMNLSRLYTVLSRQIGFRQTLHIGRVITPTVALVCQRDQQIAQFKPEPFWTLGIDVSVQNGQFKAQWQPPEECCDEQDHCINKAYAEQVASQVKGTQATIGNATTKQSYESAPLPFDLSSLQQHANKQWGYTAEEVLKAAQALYETHKATTYPRTDCRYLPVAQRDDIHDVLQALILSDQDISGVVAGADPDRKARVFNDKKITAHHAIIPTSARHDIQAMSEIEFRLYDAIRRHYIAQFYSAFEFDRTTIEVICGQHSFVAKGKTPLQQGWKVLFAADTSDEQDADDVTTEQSKLPRVRQGEPAMVNAAEITDKMTRPPAYFTEATLLSAMERIAQFVTEEQFKKILKETAGLGTPATRAGIIQGAVDKGYFKRQKKRLMATDKAHALMAVLPPAIKSPGLTAAWEQELETIADGNARMSVFMQQITRWVDQMVAQVKQAAPALTASDGAMTLAFGEVMPPTHECFNCGGELRRIKGKYGYFWGCQNDACKKTFRDNRGKPEKPIAEKDRPQCPECGQPMRVRKGKKPGNKRASKFWGCSGFPNCKGTLPYQNKARKAPGNA